MADHLLRRFVSAELLRPLVRRPSFRVARLGKLPEMDAMAVVGRLLYRQFGRRQIFFEID
jgi:hypothetical protein